jgi:hypothetical protein
MLVHLLAPRDVISWLANSYWVHAWPARTVAYTSVIMYLDYPEDSCFESAINNSVLIDAYILPTQDEHHICTFSHNFK